MSPELSGSKPPASQAPLALATFENQKATQGWRRENLRSRAVAEYFLVGKCGVQGAPRDLVQTLNCLPGPLQHAVLKLCNRSCGFQQVALLHA